MNGRVSSALVALALLVSGPAYADFSTGGSVLGNTQGEGTRGGLLNYNRTRFGVPDPTNTINGDVGAPKVGFQGDVNLAQGTTNLGPCEVTGAIGQVGVDVSAGIGGSGQATKGGNTVGVAGPTPKTGAAGGLGAGGLVQCNASIEANLVSVTAECQTAIGTIKPSVKGPGGSAGCSCSQGCSAEIYWAKAGIEYTTPAVGGCGIQVSGTVGAEVMAGVAAGAERVGTVGGRVALGPVGVTAGVNVEEFDLGKTADCIMDAAEAVADAASDVARAAADVGEAVVSGIADAGQAIGSGIADAGEAIGSGIASAAESVGGFFGGLFGGGDDDDEPEQPTTVIAYNAPGVDIPRNAAVGTAAPTGPAASVPSQQQAGTARGTDAASGATFFQP